MRVRYRQMQRFYFHLHNDVEARDSEGKEFADVAGARAYAEAQIRSLVGETIKETGRLVLSHRIDIEDQQADVLATVRFGDAIEVDP